MRIHLKHSGLLMFVVLAFTYTMSAQVTTATLSGSVKDPKGAALASATVTVEFSDAGIKQVLTTNADGRFTLSNLRVGGPYKVTVNHVSHQQTTTENIFLDLGLNNSVEITMEETAKELTG